MRPILWQWRGLTIYSYPAMLYVGLITGITAGNYAANLAALDSASVYIATLLLLIPALAGARLLYVCFKWTIYRHEPARIWRRAEGGAAMYGGLALAVPLSVPLLGLMHVPFGAFWDVVVFTMLVGLLFARVGCLLNGCCGGRPTSGRLSLYLPDHRGIWRRRIPTQLLDAGWGAVLLAGAVLLWGRLPFPGALFLYTLGSYGLGRFLLEFTREEQTRLVGRWTVDQVVSAALVLIALAFFVTARPRM